jgi:hypothetical protein
MQSMTINYPLTTTSEEVMQFNANNYITTHTNTGSENVATFSGADGMLSLVSTQQMQKNCLVKTEAV